MLHLPLRGADEAAEGQPCDTVQEDGLFQSFSTFRDFILLPSAAVPIASRRLSL
jgi:hypothetical protein